MSASFTTFVPLSAWHKGMGLLSTWACAGTGLYFAASCRCASRGRTQSLDSHWLQAAALTAAAGQPRRSRMRVTERCCA